MDRAIEERSLNNWQALSTMLYDGWVLRFADGYTKRANSINPLYDSSLDVDEKIAECEAIYAGKGLPPVYRITPFVQPENLDQLLVAKGYKAVDLTSVQTVMLDSVQEPAAASVVLEEACTERWVADVCRLNSVDHKHQTTMLRMFSNIPTKACFFSLLHGEAVVACGLGVIDRGCIGLHGIVTDEAYRNQGFGKQTVLQLLHWGKANGAKSSYLAVLADNQPALSLYANIGFAEAYRYWYRVKA